MTRLIFFRLKKLSYLLLLCIVISQSIFCNISITLTQRQLCDLELILNKGFAPLEGFMTESDYNSVVETMRLADGSVWPMPITLDITQETAQKLLGVTTKSLENNILELRSPEGRLIANMNVEDIWKPNKLNEAEKVYRTTSTDHPGVQYLLNKTHDYYVGGKVDLVAMPHHYDFAELRKTPAELKQYFKENNISQIVAFQTRNPMHRAHFEITERAAKEINGHLLLHPVVGLTKPGDVDHFTRVHCYKELYKNYPRGSTTLSLLPLAMRMAGPREALWHALIRKNYGCTHFIIGRDHAGPGADSNGNLFYGPYDAQDLVMNYANEIGITVVPFKMVIYLPDEDRYEEISKITPDTRTAQISGTQLRKMLKDGVNPPEWFTYPEIAKILQKTYPPRNKQGFTLFFTGLSGSGKSTLANAVAIKLMELQDRKISLFDGDIVRKFLTSELGFSKQHRSLNVRRIGFVANEASKNGGAALCAFIAPYQQDREENRQLISALSNYIEVYVSTSLAECEKRDTKGLYEKARAGIIQQFTGISDPYETPKNAEIIIDTETISIDDGAKIIIDYLTKQGYIE